MVKEMRFFIMISIMMVVGCTTVSERTAQAEHDMDVSLLIYGPACEKLGYQKDSDSWRGCVLRLDAKRGPCMHRRL